MRRSPGSLYAAPLLALALAHCSSDRAESTASEGASLGIVVDLPSALGGSHGLTGYSSSETPAKTHPSGALLPSPPHAGAHAGVESHDAQSLSPPTVDLSSGIPPVRDQKDTSSCQSWAAGYYTMGWWASRSGLTNPQFAPMYIYSQISGGNCSSPQNAEPALDILQQQGIDTASDYEPMEESLDCATTPNAAQRAGAAHFKITGYSKNDLSQGAQQAITASLTAGYPAILSITAYAELENANGSNYVVGPPKDGETAYGGHVVAAFKYDATGVWVVNSWGSDWGYNGWAVLSWAFVDGTFDGQPNVWDVDTVTGVEITCQDSSTECGSLASASQCQENPGAMLTACCASCANPLLAYLEQTYRPLASTSSCMDVSGDATADYTPVDEWACNGTPAQAFEVVSAGNGLVTLYHPHSGKCVDVYDGGTADRTPINVFDCNGTAAQQFDMRSNEDGTRTFAHPASGRCLDVTGGSSADGTRLQIWDCNGTNAQKWSAVGE